MLQCFVSHDGPKVGAADADVDDVANAFASVAFPLAAPHAVGEISHLIEDGVDVRHDVLAINNDGCPFWRAQSHMQDSAVFRDIDLFTPEHSVDPPTQARLVCELHE